MQKKIVTLMLLVVAVTSANLDPTIVERFADWVPLESSTNYRIDSRMRRQVPSTDVKQETSTSNSVPIIDGPTLLTELASVQSPTIGVRQASSAISLPADTSAISLNSCIFIELKLVIIINILHPVSCSTICARNSHFTHEPLKSGGTCTLHKPPVRVVSGRFPHPEARTPFVGTSPRTSVSSDGSLLNLCLDLGLSISLGLL
ncbi:uncharacterized protein LOC132088544 [Daphnia carinata]|uniref:uncharacterized protein LOC132088544 n=1 Tax=Daphnia carinata TaxID=120202 RepID=UPI00286939BC|nr:uncharacterized protein LOC132088544 [Daphnia carinata]